MHLKNKNQVHEDVNNKPDSVRELNSLRANNVSLQKEINKTNTMNIFHSVQQRCFD